jgi:hypothetical protein
MAASALLVSFACGCAAETQSGDPDEQGSAQEPKTGGGAVGTTVERQVVNPPGYNPPGYNPAHPIANPPGYNPPGTGVACSPGVYTAGCVQPGYNPPGYNPPGTNPYNPALNPPGYNPPGTNPPGPY